MAKLKTGLLSAAFKTPVLLILFPFFYGCATPLISAAHYGDTKEVTKLLDSGVDPNQSGRMPLSDVLINFSGMVTPCGQMFCTIAPGIGLPGFGAFMCPIFLVVNAIAPVTTTPLEQAICQDRKDVTRILLDHGAKVSWQWGRGLQGAVNFAKQNQLGEMEDFLRNDYHQEYLTTFQQTSKPSESQVPPVEIGTGLDATSPPKASRHAFARKAVPNSSVDTPDYSERARPDDFALVVGVEKYAQDLPAAQFADRDAEAMRRHLLALGVPARHIVFLHDALATRSELVKNIERWLPKNVKPNSRVYFYFSGHGSPDPQTGQAYLVGFDGDPSDLSDTAYPLSRLYAKLEKLKARQVIVALDSCFSGAGGRSVIAQGARPLVNRIQEGRLSPNGKIIALTASKSDQISGVMEDKGHGAFTYYLLKGLNGAALDSQDHVTLKSLYQYLKPKVEDAAHLDNRDQDPQLLPLQSPAARLTLK